MYTGNDNLRALDAVVTGGTGATTYATYNATLGNMSSRVAGTRNYYARVQSNATMTGATATKVYDGSNTALGFTNLSGATVSILGCTSANVSNLTVSNASYNTTHVGTGLGLSVTGNSAVQLVANSHNWSVTGFTATQTGGTGGTITPKNVTVTLSNVTKTYDGNTNATVNGSTATGLLSGDTLAVTGNGTYNNQHVLNATNASFNTASLNRSLTSATLGSQLSDYNISYANTTSGAAVVGGTITKANVTLTGNLTANDKVYDATNTATVNVGNVTARGVNGETLTVCASGATAAFNTTHVGNGLNVTIGNVTLSNGTGLVSDYNTQSLNANATANITPAALTVTASNDTKVYDGTTTSGGSATVTGLKGADRLNGTVAQQFNSSHALGANGSTLSVAQNLTNASITGGGYITDYNVTYVNNVGTVTPKNVTVTLSNVTKTYDGTTNATVNGSSATGLLSGDTLAVTGNGSYNNQHVLNASNASFNTAGLSGNLTSATLGSRLSDYNVSYANTSNGAAVVGGTITKANVTVTGNLTANDKVYDATNTATVNTSGVTARGVNGETLTVNTSGATAAFNTTHVGNGLNVTIGNVTLSNGTGLVSDYNTPTLNRSTTANITPAALTVTASNDTKVYDGTTTSGGSATVTGLKGADRLNGTVAQQFNSSHVLGANGSTLAANQLSNASITGGGFITDYNVTYVNNVGTVTPKNVTVTLSNVTKTYDGNANATVNGSTATGLLAGDTLAVTGNGSYNSQHVLNASNASFNTAGLSGNLTSATLGSRLSDYNVSYANTSNGAAVVGGKITPA
ncbi:hypothetical protein ABIC76_005122, partial [Ralstonia sp. 1138]